MSLKISDYEYDNLGYPDGDTNSEKLSSTVDNPSNKPAAQQCRFRSGTLLFS
jgi:hypothetical protein